MSGLSAVRWLRAGALCALVLLAACGGGGDGATANQPPTATIGLPTEGTLVKAGDSLDIAVSASDAEDGALAGSQLSWWIDLHHDDHTHPFQLPTAGTGATVTLPTRGETSDNIWYRIHLRATDSAGAQADTFRDVMPLKSRVSLVTAPAGLQLTLDGQGVAGPYAFTGVVGMERDIAAADQVFNGRQYRFEGWSDGAAAEHTISTPPTDLTLTATFTDLGPVANAPPTVTLDAPASATVGVAASLSATAADADGTVAKVEFFDGAVLIASDTSSPYTATWVPVTAGSHSLTARATDNTGAQTTGAAVSVSVAAAPNAPPSVAVAAPTSATVGMAVSLTATAADGDGSVTKVEFFDGTTLLATDASSPYAATWAPTTPGAHTITARAIDNRGAAAISAPTVVDVSPVGNTPPTVSLVAPSSGSFGVPIALSATASDADGTVTEVAFFDGAALIGTDATAPYGISWTPTSAGSRSLTARATDNAGATRTSAAVVVAVAAPPNVPPTIALSAPSSAAVGAVVNLIATVSDVDGSVTQVEFFDGTTSLGADTTSPFTLAWTPATAGARSLSARATDNAGASTTSAVVSVTVAAAGDTQPPTAALTAPANLADNLAGSIVLQASASDNIGVVAVEFQVDGVAVGEAAASPYAVTVDTESYASGQHVLRARARDAAGNLSSWATRTVRFGGARPVPAGFMRNEAWISGAGSGTAFVQAPDGRFFVAVQNGRLLVVKNDVLLPTPFLTLKVDATGERGLLGVALHPDFATNGWVYVYYTRVNGSLRNNRISRFVARGDVSTGVETVGIDLPNLSAVNHNGGAMRFGPDRKLYVAVGDNATGTKAQNLNDPFGKVLRFNDDFSIPSDNPFCTTAGNIACAVWAYGLRNPFTFAFQPGTARMHINDVGQNTWEEINLGAARANFGWPASEGPNNVTPAVTAPIFAYRHTDTSPPGNGPGGFFVGKAVVGGTFYPASGPFPAPYRGKYFFGDYVNRWVGVLDVANGNAAYAFAEVGPFIVDLLVGNDGALYVLGRSVPDQLNFSIVRISAP